MWLVDQLPYGSVLTPAIPCTKFKIYSAHVDSPMAKTGLLFNFLGKDQSLLHRPRNSGRECAWWTNSLVGQFLHQLFLCKVQDPFSTCRQSHSRNRLSFQFFKEDQSLLHRSRNSGRECAWWTNSLVDQFLHQLSLVQSSRSIQHMQTVP